VIAFNALWIAIDTDMNKAAVLVDAKVEFQIVENLFCAFFVFEWMVKFIAFRYKRSPFKDKWFVFETFLVCTMVLETWMISIIILSTSDHDGVLFSVFSNASVLRIARLMRLTRMARMARLLRAFPELLILIKGMVASMRSVFTTLLLLVLFLYVFGIAFAQLTSGTKPGRELFSDVSTSMYTLLLYGVLSLDFVGDVASSLADVSFLLAVLFFVFVLLAALTVMNMLIGVLCEIVSAVAATEKEELLVSYVKGKLEDTLTEIDKDGDGKISKDEFENLLDSKQACMALSDVGVDVVGLVDFADVIFEAEESLTLSQFMDVVLQLRSKNTATVKDIIELRKLMKEQRVWTQTILEAALDVNLTEKILSSPRKLAAVGGKMLGSPIDPRSKNTKISVKGVRR